MGKCSFISFASLASLLILAVSCFGDSKKVVNVKDISKSMRELLKDEKPFVDPSISGIEIKSSESAIKVTGKMPLTQSSVFGTIRVINSDSTEVVDLISDKGLAKGEFTKFRLRKSSPDALKNQTVTILDKINNFESSRGVKIGIMPSELKTLFLNVKPVAQRSNGEKTYIQYRIQDKDDSKFLEKMGANEYFGNYVFDKTGLIHAYWGINKSE